MNAKNDAMPDAGRRNLLILGLFPPITVAAASVAGGRIVALGLADYGGGAAAGWILGGSGIIFSVLLAAALLRAESRIPIFAAATISVGLCLAVAYSFTAGTVRGERFGWTVVGVVPVPVLDITIDAEGRLGFRSKTHEISASEIRRLAGTGARTVVVGVGWDEVARVTAEATEIEGVEIITLPTPEAHEEFNRRRRAGNRVALISHSTC